MQKRCHEHLQRSGLGGTVVPENAKTIMPELDQFDVSYVILVKICVFFRSFIKT